MPEGSKPERFSRRALLKGVAAAGIGTVTGAAAHGYLYERHDIELTVNWWVFAPATRSVSLKVSSTVGTAGVGVVGATGSPHPVASRTAPSTAQRVRFICS